MRIFRVVPIVAVVAAFLVVAGVASAAAPSATTSAATSIGSTGATLNGTVSPNKERTTVSFQYGTTTAYGATAAAGTVSGNASKAVSVAISGLTPSTVYHFRVTASNASGQSVGQSVTFTTTASGPPPSGKNTVDIAASPGTVTYGHSGVISGKVSGRKSGGVRVALQAQPYPFTTAFKPTGAVTSTAANGHYSFTVLPRTRTRYRVLAQTAPPVTSGVATVGVRYAVSFFVSSRFVRHGALVRFSGSVRPAANGRLVFIQRLTRTGVYQTVAMTVLRATTSSTRSSYSKRFRIFHTGVYRVRIRGHVPYAASNSRSRKITVI